MEEENKRRKKGGYQDSALALNEEDEDDEAEAEAEDYAANVSSVEQKLRKTNIGHGGNTGAHLPAAGTAVPKGASAYSTQVASARGMAKKAAAAAAGPPGVGKRRNNFELSLDNATLLGRRKRGGDEPVLG